MINIKLMFSLFLIFSVTNLATSQTTLTCTAFDTLHILQLGCVDSSGIECVDINNDTIKLLLKPKAKLTIRWKFKECPMKMLLEKKYIIPIDPNKAIINDSLRLNVTTTSESLYFQERKNLNQLFKYSIIPGGARFYKHSNTIGIIIASLEVAPIPFAFWFNHDRNKYYEKAQEAAKQRNLEDLNRFYNKSQDFRCYRDVAITISAAAFLFNLLDVLLNVRKIVQVPRTSLIQYKTNTNFSFAPIIKGGQVMFNVVKSF